MSDKHQISEEQQVEQAFLKGFEDENEATGRTAQPVPAEAEGPKETAVETKAEAPKPEEAPDKAGGKKPVLKPEYVRLTKPEYEALKTSAGKVPELEKRIETAFGKFGPTQQALNEIKATIEELRAATPKGQALELPADVVSELEAEFPDVAGGVKAALVKLMKGLAGTGNNDADREKGEKARFDKWAVARAASDLEEIHPKWREIVGAVEDPTKADPNNQFRVWLAKQPETYQAQINNSNSATVISRAIDKFLTSQKSAAQPPLRNKLPLKKVTLRRDRIQGSVQPKGLGAPPPAQRESVEDAFSSGFKSG